LIKNPVYNRTFLFDGKTISLNKRWHRNKTVGFNLPNECCPIIAILRFDEFLTDLNVHHEEGEN